MDCCSHFTHSLCVVLCCFAAFSEKGGVTIFSHKRIAAHYIRGWFIIDLVACLPWESMATVVSSGATGSVFVKILKSCKALRLLRLSRLFKFLERQQLMGHVMRMMRMLFFFFLFAHWVACMWYALGAYAFTHSDGVDGWLPACAPPLDPNASPFSDLYVTSLYWVLTTWVTVGYGDVLPRTDLEKCFAMSVMVVGAVVYATIFGNVAILLQSLGRLDTIFKTKMETVNFYMDELDLPPAMQVRVRNYYTFLWARHKSFSSSNQLEELPPSLTNQIAQSVGGAGSARGNSTGLHCASWFWLFACSWSLRSRSRAPLARGLCFSSLCVFSLSSFLHQDTIDRCEIFKNADESFLRSVTTRLKFCVSLPGDFVFKEDEAGDKIYFLRKGRIEISTEEDGTLTLLEEGAYFGEISLVLPPPAAAAAVEKAAAEAAARSPHRRGSSSIAGPGGVSASSPSSPDAPPGTPSAASLTAEYGRRKRSASAKSLINSDMYFLLRDEFLSILATYTQYQFLFVAIAEQRLKQTKLHRDELLVEKILELHLKKGWLRLAGFKKQAIRAPGAAPAPVNAGANAGRATVSGVSSGGGGMKRSVSPMPASPPGVRFAPTPSPPSTARAPAATAAATAAAPSASISSPSGAAAAPLLRSPSRLTVPPASLTVDTGATPTPPQATPAAPATVAAASTESKSLES